MKRDVSLFLSDILKSIENIENYIENLKKAEFFRDEESQDAVMRRLEIIGEAVKNLPESFQKKHLKIPWKKIANMRNILIHEYFGVNLERVWETIKKDIPSLKRHIASIVKNLQK